MEPVAEILEELLVARAQLGDQAAFEQLVREYHPRLIYYVAKLLMKRELAEDVMQDVWQAVYRKLPKLRNGQAFPVWIYRIAYTKAIDTIRTESRYVELPEDGECSSNTSPGEREFSADDIRMLHAAIDGLSRPLREVIVLRFLEDMSYEDISQVANVPVGTVRSRIHTAKQLLRKRLEGLRT